MTNWYKKCTPQNICNPLAPEGENLSYADLARRNYVLFAIAGTVSAAGTIFNAEMLRELANDCPDDMVYNEASASLWIAPALYYAYHRYLLQSDNAPAKLARREVAYYLRAKASYLELRMQDDSGIPLDLPDPSHFHYWACSSCHRVLEPDFTMRPRPEFELPSLASLYPLDRNLANWRYNGDTYEHKCEGADPQAGHFDAYPLGVGAIGAVRIITEVELQSVSVCENPPEPRPDWVSGLFHTRNFDAQLRRRALDLFSDIVGGEWTEYGFSGYGFMSPGELLPFDPAKAEMEIRALQHSTEISFTVKKSELETTERGRQILAELRDGRLTIKSEPEHIPGTQIVEENKLLEINGGKFPTGKAEEGEDGK